MTRLIQSLSLGTGALLIAVVSSVSVWLLCRISPVQVWKVWVVLLPAVLTYCLYWSPVWLLGEPRSEYSVWQFVFYIPWFLAGAIPSALTVRFFQTRR